MEETRISSIADNECDRISELPEALIHHILSFLDMKCVVQTCVLSKRWRYVWPSVSNLVFRGDEFGEPGDEFGEPWVKQLKKFKKFVGNVLMRRGFSDIHKFHLHWGNCYSQTDKIVNKHLNVWIFDVLKCNVQDLSICIEQDGRCFDHRMRFSHFLFNSQSLSKLVLDLTNNCESQVILPKSMDLPKLKFISLGSFFVEDGDSINRLISSCPILESLILRDIWIENGYDVNVKIESHGLKHLEINSNIEILVWSHYNMAKIIKLSTPNLTSFICKDYMLQEYCLENVSSLITADIDIVKEYKHDALHDSDLEISEKEKQRLYPKRMVQFIKAFRDVKELTISSPGFLQVLADSPDLIEGRCPQFCNLRCLKLKTWFTRRCLLAVTYLLKICPHIESLYLTSEKLDYRFNKKDTGEVELSVPCLLSHLKRIEIREVKGCDSEVKFLGLLLMNALVLKEMVLSFDTSSSQDTVASPDGLKLVENFSEKLRTLPKASPNLTLIFLNAGIDVTVGVEEELCRNLNEAYIHRMLTGKPFVTLRYSQSVNGQILDKVGLAAKEPGGYYSQLLQAYGGVILSIGSLTGDSTFPISQEPQAKQPLQIIVARTTNSPLQIPVLTTDAATQVIIFAETDTVVNPETTNQGAETVVMGKVNLNAILDYCASRGLCSVLVDFVGDCKDLEELVDKGLEQGLVQKLVMEVLPVWKGRKESEIQTTKILAREVHKLKKLQSRVLNESVIVEGYF